jgi:hypothetical protein
MKLSLASKLKKKWDSGISTMGSYAPPHGATDGFCIFRIHMLTFVIIKKSIFKREDLNFLNDPLH